MPYWTAYCATCINLAAIGVVRSHEHYLTHIYPLKSRPPSAPHKVSATLLCGHPATFITSEAQWAANQPGIGGRR